MQAQTIATHAEQENARYERLENRYDRLETRYDKLEGELQQIQRNLFPHQQWDLLVHRKVLELDPNFPPPPDLLP
ncbi:hypothetical protein [Nocardia grenadensis]|uniref:hypothetical protein n=1 Tax=Nocardia grenadensis TaxID=931537 RepID=UPI0012EEDF28|nr:hypothetical protein [Nocardia grenadensis]